MRRVAGRMTQTKGTDDGQTPDRVSWWASETARSCACSELVTRSRGNELGNGPGRKEGLAVYDFTDCADLLKKFYLFNK